MQFLQRPDLSGIGESGSSKCHRHPSCSISSWCLKRKSIFIRPWAWFPVGKELRNLASFPSIFALFPIAQNLQLPQITSFQWHRIFQRECNNSTENLAFLTAYLPLSSELHKLCCLWMWAGQHHFPGPSWFMVSLNYVSASSANLLLLDRVWCDLLLGGQFANYVLIFTCWFITFYNFKVTNNY